MTDWYPQLAAAVRAAGYFTNGVERKEDLWSRTTICSCGANGVLGGNSFWVTWLGGAWYLGVWGGGLYRLSRHDVLIDLMLAWFEKHPKKTQSDFDAHIKSTFGLVAISDEEFDEAIRSA